MHFYYASADDLVKNWKLDKAEATHRLTTYYKIDGLIAERGVYSSSVFEAREKDCAKALKMFRECSGVNSWVIDSGAFTYQKAKNRIPLSSLMAYAERYIEFCQKSIDLWGWCAELDVEKVYGQDFVEEVWSKMIAAGLPALRVWHPERGINAFKRYCNERQYVGIGSSQMHEDDTTELLKWAYSNGNKVHIFGELSRQLAKWPCYSSDAISWLTSEAWAQIVKFDRNKGKLIFTKPRKTGLNMSNLSIIANSRIEGDHSATIESIKEIQAYEKYLTDSWEERGVTFDDLSSPKWVAGEI